MKNFSFYLSLGSLIILGSCSLPKPAANNMDDVYYTPSEKKSKPQFTEIPKQPDFLEGSSDNNASSSGEYYNQNESQSLNNNQYSNQSTGFRNPYRPFTGVSTLDNFCCPSNPYMWNNIGYGNGFGLSANFWNPTPWGGYGIGFNNGFNPYGAFGSPFYDPFYNPYSSFNSPYFGSFYNPYSNWYNPYNNFYYPNYGNNFNGFYNGFNSGNDGRNSNYGPNRNLTGGRNSGRRSESGRPNVGSEINRQRPEKSGMPQQNAEKAIERNANVIRKVESTTRSSSPNTINRTFRNPSSNTNQNQINRNATPKRESAPNNGTQRSTRTFVAPGGNSGFSTPSNSGGGTVSPSRGGGNTVSPSRNGGGNTSPSRNNINRRR